MLTRLVCRTVTAVTCALLFMTAAAVWAGGSPADDFLALRKSLHATAPPISSLKAGLPSYIGKTVEFTGTINGLMRCEDTISFMIDSGGEGLIVRAQGAVPDCIFGGSTVRVLAIVGPGCATGLSDLQFQGAAYEYEVSAREKELTPKPKPKQPVPADRGSNPKSFKSAQQARGVNLSNRAAQIYEPYRAAIARFNPRLTREQLDTITTSILAFSEHYGIDPRLVIALILTESGFKPTAKSHAGAMGLGQLMPGTARGLGVSNAYDPMQNIEASVRLMRGHLDNYGDLSLALSAYNAGPGAVKKYKGVPPYRETQNYIRKVDSLYKALCGEN